MGDSPTDIKAGMAAGCLGRVSVNAPTRDSVRMEHEDVTHEGLDKEA